MRRRITWGARLRILLHARGVGFMLQLAWGLLLGGAMAFIGHWRHWHLDATAVATVDRSWPVHRKKGQDPRWYVSATFVDARGIEHRVSSYRYLPASGALPVRYDAAEPSHAVLELGDPEIDPESDVKGWILFMFALGGLSVGLSLVRAWRKLRLVQRGAVAEGRFVSERKGVKTRHDQERYLAYEFDVPDHGKQRIEAYLFGPGPLVDQPTGTIFYDPRRPSRGLVLEYLPGAPELRSDGTIAARGGGAWAAFVPAVALGACLVALVKLATFYV